MENIPAQPAIPNIPPVSPSVGPLKKWPILIILLVILLALIVVSQAKLKPTKPTTTAPSKIPASPTASDIHLPTYQGIIKSLSPNSLTIEASGSAITSKINKLNKVFKFISAPKEHVATASASELKVGQEVYVTVNINSEITSITILK